MNSIKLIGITPFELPDLALLKELSATAFLPVLHVGRDANQTGTLYKAISNYPARTIGLCFSNSYIPKQQLPQAVGYVILPFGKKAPFDTSFVEVVYQVHSLQEALDAEKLDIKTIIIKGNESAGKIANSSTFILFQRIMQEKALKRLNIWVQGGVGIHAASAFIALGAQGIILDNQFVLYTACSAPHQLKLIVEKLNGNETKIVDNYRILVRPNSPKLPPNATHKDLLPYLNGYDLEASYLPVGQDIILSKKILCRYKTIQHLASGLMASIIGHLKQAKELDVIKVNNPLAKALGTKYPIAQGPMTRVSDRPAFAQAVAAAGGLPFVALSLMKGEPARALMEETSQLLNEAPWGVGILGFVPPALREEQAQYIIAAKPPVVLIAGGHPSQASLFEKEGIKTFLHVPSSVLLDLFIKENARRFIFEGRECGGHVGPLSSLVLWEQQIERILEEESLDSFELFFAGGIHDSLSSAFVSIMAAPLAIGGAKVGVLMGTAYIYTKEAVTSGAILPGFQQQALLQQETVLLETAPGHETRCLQSPFTTYFELEKAKLLREGTDKKTAWQMLEQLNVGRLRIATKGIERREENLLQVDETAQYQRGMYMIGQVAALNNSIQSISDLHQNVSNAHKHIAETELPIESISAEGLDVALIGMACIYPDAPDIEAFWRNVLDGKDCITEVPDERWNKEIYYDPNDTNGTKSPSKWGGFIPKIEFDPLEFGIPPQSLAAIDPTQLLSLLVAKRALEDAGYASINTNKENVSVILGAEGGNDLANNYSFRALFSQFFGSIPQEIDAALPKLTEDSFPGVLANVIAGRITNRLDLGGRNYTVDAACASSLAALDLACQELILGKSEMVIAGAADLHNGINDYLMFASTHALSRKGRCATFDTTADGIALGEGIAMVVLKRLQDAQRDGDKIYAVIKGIGGSSDGKSLGLTAPRLAGQIKALERAYAQANISPAAVELIEAHGTGTVVGDRTELTALTRTMQKFGAIHNQTHLGSVKTQIGHTKCAAGMAGLIKSALSVYYGIKPPTINLKQPNSYYKVDNSPFVFTDKAKTWSSKERIAGISAFGFGGTNFHTVIANTTEGNEKPFSATKQWPMELFVFRGQSLQEAFLLLRQVKQLITINDSLKLRDIAFSLASYSNELVQLSILATSNNDLLSKIDLALSGTYTKEIYLTKTIIGKTAFLFAGQGSQRINMARELMVHFPGMRSLLDQSPASYRDTLFPNQAFDQETLTLQQDRINDTRIAQPLLGIVDLAIAKLLNELGIMPDMLAGHSYGELPALAFANVFGESQLLSLSRERADAILSSITDDYGAMVAVQTDVATINQLLSDHHELYLVNHNAPNQHVIAGKTAIVDHFITILKKNNISFRKLTVACAFHSPLIKQAEPLYYEKISGIPFNKPDIPVWSNTTASPYPEEEEGIKSRLAKHIVSPVRFTEQIVEMYAQGARIFIEVGPGKSLTNLVKSTLGKDEILLNTEEKDKDGIIQLLSMLAQFMATGRSAKLNTLFADRDAKMLDLDRIDKFKKSSSIWMVDGQRATPLHGKLPVYSTPPVIKPIVDFKNLKTQIPQQHNSMPITDSAERLTLEYLASIKTLIQAQRDVLLAYFGQNIPANIAPLPSISSKVETPVQLSAPIEPSVQTIPNATTPTQKDLSSILLEVVSEKTGYPIEMLGMELDLEADLSIDSIKRMEIIGELRLQLASFKIKGEHEEDIVEQLATIKTLNGLLDWFGTRFEFTSTPKEIENIEIQKLSKMDIQEVILETVSEKTGYPKEMLGLDLDIEADLSIDSIKRMEIIGALKSNLAGQLSVVDVDAENIEKGATFKTLRDLVDWISLNNVQAHSKSAAISAKTTAPIVKHSNFGLKRIKFELMSATISPIAAGESGNINGKRIAITRDGKLGDLIKVALEKKGAIASLVTQNDPLGDYDGLIILDMNVSKHRLNIIEAVNMVKALDIKRVKWIYVLSDHHATHLQHHDPKFLRTYQGYTGFIKSLDKEYENTKCRTLHFMRAIDESKISDVLVNELQCTDEPALIYYNENGRHALKETHEPLSIANKKPFVLDKKAVILVLGGAQGITAALTTHLAKDFPCHYILVGRSPYPTAGRLPGIVQTKEQIRQYLIEQEYAQNPAIIEQQTAKLYKEKQIIATMEAIKAEGSKVSYHTVDVRDERKFIAFLQGIYAEHGRIDGVIHGAGILEDKLFKNKTPDSFERVFSTKVTPLRVLAEHLDNNTQFVVFFSSIASVYGNRGQTDYAAANSVLDHYAETLGEKMKGRVMAINWGPWKGAGMVSAALEKEYERRGISLIPLENGKETFANEIKYGNEGRVLIMA